MNEFQIVRRQPLENSVHSVGACSAGTDQDYAPYITGKYLAAAGMVSQGRFDFHYDCCQVLARLFWPCVLPTFSVGLRINCKYIFRISCK
jgi:hypothetical protein